MSVYARQTGSAKPDIGTTLALVTAVLLFAVGLGARVAARRCLPTPGCRSEGGHSSASGSMVAATAGWSETRRVPWVPALETVHAPFSQT